MTRRKELVCRRTSNPTSFLSFSFARWLGFVITKRRQRRDIATHKITSSTESTSEDKKREKSCSGSCFFVLLSFLIIARIRQQTPFCLLSFSFFLRAFCLSVVGKLLVWSSFPCFLAAAVDGGFNLSPQAWRFPLSCHWLQSTT
jgi:hypothetical protein